VNIENMRRHERYAASDEQECEEANIVSGEHTNSSKLTETIPIMPAAEHECSANEDQIA